MRVSVLYCYCTVYRLFVWQKDTAKSAQAVSGQAHIADNHPTLDYTFVWRQRDKFDVACDLLDAIVTVRMRSVRVTHTRAQGRNEKKIDDITYAMAIVTLHLFRKLRVLKQILPPSKDQKRNSSFPMPRTRWYGIVCFHRHSMCAVFARPEMHSLSEMKFRYM